MYYFHLSEANPAVYVAGSARCCFTPCTLMHANALTLTIAHAATERTATHIYRSAGRIIPRKKVKADVFLKNDGL